MTFDRSSVSLRLEVMFDVVLIKVNEGYFFSVWDKNYHNFFIEININII